MPNDRKQFIERVRFIILFRVSFPWFLFIFIRYIILYFKFVIIVQDTSRAHANIVRQ